MTTNIQNVSETAKAVRKCLNAHKNNDHLKGTERANAVTFGILSDSLRDAGEEFLADVCGAIARFLPVWKHYERTVRGFTSYETWGTDRNKFIALDYGSENGTYGGSGCYLVEKATGYVWSIKAYGKKNRVVAVTLDELTARLEASAEQYGKRLAAGEVM